MLFMNEMEIEDVVRRFPSHPVLGPATRTLENLKEAVNRCSDGWAYWPVPLRAAKKLIELIQQGQRWDREKYQRPRTEEPTAEQLKAALRPLKSFRTRRGVQFEIEEAA